MTRALLVVALALPSAAVASPQLLDDVRASYAKVTSLSGGFKQTFTNATFGTDKVSRGSVYLARPDRMRWDYIDAKKDPSKSFIYDGKTLWVVEKKNQQVFQHDKADATLPAAIAFLNGGDLSKDFDVTAPDATTLELVPKQTDAQVRKLTFVVDATTKRVVKSIVVNHKDDVNTFEFALADKPVDKKTFQFSPKRVPTYKVIRVN